MILEQLRRETRPQHAALEHALPPFDSQLALGTYLALLERFYGFYEPLEQRLRGQPWYREIDLDYDARLKTPRLERDLMALGEDGFGLSQLPRCTTLPYLGNAAAGLGCLYVVEGSTLGGQYITRLLSEHLRLTTATGGAFFAGYQAETGQRWREFCAVLERGCRSDEDAQWIIRGARETFASIQHWLAPLAASASATTHELNR